MARGKNSSGNKWAEELIDLEYLSISFPISITVAEIDTSYQFTLPVKHTSKERADSFKCAMDLI